MFSVLRLFDGVSKHEKRLLLSSVKRTMFAPGVILFKKTINLKVYGLCLMASYT
jgi:hypothetical protein